MMAEIPVSFVEDYNRPEEDIMVAEVMIHAEECERSDFHVNMSR